MCCRCCSVKQQKIWVFTIGSIVLILGIVLITAWPTLSEKLVASMLPLQPNSFTFSNWVVTPIPLHLTFYLYNWTNPEQASNPNVKPHFEELGPYKFRDIKVKEDLEWDNVNNLVTFYGRRTWWFDESKSNGSLDDIVITPYIPSAAASRMSRNMHPILRKIVNFWLNREGGDFVMKHTAIEWLFDGFYDDIIDFVERLHSPIFPLHANNFAWFYKRNNSKEAEGTFTIHTGKGDLSQMGDLKYWNGSDHTNYWEGECGRINGSTGELWAPGKAWNDPVSIFLSDAARYINIFPQTNETYRGVAVRRYTSTDQTFDSGYVAPDTKCFCVKGFECPKNGVIDFSPVALRAPIYLSHPHFYMTDPLYRENTTGLNPDPAKHSIHALLEPKIGVPLDFNGQVLLSVLVEQDEKIDFLKDIAWNFYAPLFVIQIKADISEDLLRTVKLILNIPSIGQYVGIAFTVIGIIMIAFGIFLTKKHKWRGDVYPPKLEHNKF